MTGQVNGQPRQLLIGGQWRQAASGRMLDVINPANGEVFAQAAAGGAEDIDAAVHAAREAFERGPWRTRLGRLKVSDLIRQ